MSFYQIIVRINRKFRFRNHLVKIHVGNLEYVIINSHSKSNTILCYIPLLESLLLPPRFTRKLSTWPLQHRQLKKLKKLFLVLLPHIKKKNLLRMFLMASYIWILVNILLTVKYSIWIKKGIFEKLLILSIEIWLKGSLICAPTYTHTLFFFSNYLLWSSFADTGRFDNTNAINECTLDPILTQSK